MWKSWKLEKMETFLENLFLLGSLCQEEGWFCFEQLCPRDLPLAVIPVPSGLEDTCGWLVRASEADFSLPPFWSFEFGGFGIQSPGLLTSSASCLVHRELEEFCFEFVKH